MGLTSIRGSAKMTAPFVWPEGLDEVWAKSPLQEDAEGETLVRHTWEVLDRIRELALLRPFLSEQIRMPNVWNVLFWAGLFHDWGKSAKGFQAALRGQAPRWPHRHEVLSLAFLDWIAENLSEEESLWVAAAIVSHHRDADDVLLLYPPDLLREEEASSFSSMIDDELEERVVRRLFRWLQMVVPIWYRHLEMERWGVELLQLPTEEEAVAQVFQMAAKRIAKWLQSYGRLVENFPCEREAIRKVWGLLLRGYLIQADHAASAHVGSFRPIQIEASSIIAEMGVPQPSLYPHQIAAWRTLGQALLIAPTGSGKTEAALLWAAKQAEPKKHHLPRLFYVLPYQASMNAMYDRLRILFPEAVGLVHGRSALALYRRCMEQEDDPIIAHRVVRLMENINRLHLSPARVCSPYQLLKAAYQLKGYEAMLADFAGAAFVFDEIHAYEPVRLAMILEFVRYLRENMGAKFFVMSATFPTIVQKQLEEALGSYVLIRAPQDLLERFRRHRISLISGDMMSENGRRRILSSFEQGQTVLVVCNKVDRAQEMYRAIRIAMPEDMQDRVFLIHGRFNGRDRIRKEGAILSQIRLDGPRSGPCIVVSTQVVEVSLNIDLDTLYSDPAPLEALVQRFGRVNRKGRRGLAWVHIFTEPEGGQGIYDERMVRGTIQLLEAIGEGTPLHEGALQDMLEEVYLIEGLEKDWERTFKRAAKEFREGFVDALAPFRSDPSLESLFDRLFDGVEVLPVSFLQEFRRLHKERPLEASELLVSISWRRWHLLKQTGCVWKDSETGTDVVDAPYSYDFGLEFLQS